MSTTKRTKGRPPGPLKGENEKAPGPLKGENERATFRGRSFFVYTCIAMSFCLTSGSDGILQIARPAVTEIPVFVVSELEIRQGEVLFQKCS